MRYSFSHHISKRRFAWLMWLALLLPLAQAAATWHGLSHISLDGFAESDGKQVLHQSHCDLCLTAAAVAGGALVGEPQAAPLRAVSHQAPRQASSSVWIALPARAYQSRAPPFASR